MARVLLIHHAPTLGGGSTSLLDVALMLRDEHTVSICCPETPAYLSSLIREEGYDYVAPPHPLPVFNHFNGGHSVFTRTFWGGLWNYFRYKREWIDAIRRLAPDVVIVNSSVLTLMGPILQEAHVRCVCYVRETFPHSLRSVRTRIVRRMLDGYFDGVVFLSEYDRDSMNLQRTVVVVVRDSIRPGLFRRMSRAQALAELGLPPDRFNVLYVGGHSRLKGLDIALRSLCFMKEMGVNLIIAGEGARPVSQSRVSTLRTLVQFHEIRFDSKVTRLMKRPEISARTCYVGVQRDMSACYMAAHALIFPSSLPHQARPIIEAGVYSVPAVVSDFRNTRESLVAGINGLVFTPKSAAGLARQILRLYHDASLARELGRANMARTSIAHDFDTEAGKFRRFVNAISGLEV